jgi:hypothetical protein
MIWQGNTRDFQARGEMIKESSPSERNNASRSSPANSPGKPWKNPGKILTGLPKRFTLSPLGYEKILATGTSSRDFIGNLAEYF